MCHIPKLGKLRPGQHNRDLFAWGDYKLPKTSNTLFQCRHIPMLQRDPLASGSVFKKLDRVPLSLVVEISSESCACCTSWCVCQWILQHVISVHVKSWSKVCCVEARFAVLRRKIPAPDRGRSLNFVVNERKHCLTTQIMIAYIIRPVLGNHEPCETIFLRSWRLHSPAYVLRWCKMNLELIFCISTSEEPVHGTIL